MQQDDNVEQHLLPIDIVVVVIRFHVAGVIHTATMIYEYGGWFKEPDEFLQANFGKTGEQLIAVDEAAGHCGA